MDYTGTRREGRNSESHFFREVGADIIAHVHPTHRDPLRSEVVSRWRLGGYWLASHLLPVKAKRFPEELNAFIAGMRQRMQEYEQEHLGPAIMEAFDVDACEKIEKQAHLYLKLATHERTPSDEARNAAMNLAKMFANSKLSMLGWERVRHFVQRFEEMEGLFALIREENPLLFIYGARDQNH
jgi:hypothetical protein